MHSGARAGSVALDFFRPAAAREDALSVVAEQNDVVGFVQGILHSRRAKRHSRNSDAFRFGAFAQEALDHILIAIFAAL